MSANTASARAKAKAMHKREGSNLFHFCNYCFLGLILFIVAYPIYFVLIASFSDPAMVNSGQVLAIPKGITLEGYKAVFQDDAIMTGYKNSIIYTVTGVFFSTITTVLAAYSLSRRDLPLRPVFMMLIVFTMYFGGGMIPTYLVVQKLKMTGTMWSLIFPGMIVPYNLIVARTFFESSIPDELRESAQLDGCTEWQFFKEVAMPLSKAVIAMMILFYGVAQWNTYFNAMIYLGRYQAKYPLQLVLRNILIENQVSQEMLGDVYQAALQQERAGLIKYVSIIVSAAPLMILYPFVQKHFVKGVLIGSVKG